MDILFFLISLLSIGALILGVIKPKIVKMPSRMQAFKIFGISFFCSFVLFVIFVEPVDESTQGEDTEEELVDSTIDENQNDEDSNQEENKLTDEADHNDETNENNSKVEDKEQSNQDETSDDTESDQGSPSENNKNTGEKATKEEDTSQNDTTTETSTSNEQEESSKDESSNNQTTQDTDESSESNLTVATVTRIVDGDTIEINLDGKIEGVRLLLVDTPETKHPSKPVQPFGPEASAFAKEVLSGKQVKVEYDGPKRDHYDRLLAYLWVDGQNFNQMLLEEGLARLAYVYDPPYTHMDAFTKAQTRAANAGIGIWSINGYVQSDGFYYEEPSEDTSQEEQQKENETSNNGSSNYNGPYDPHGPDRDCGDFDTHAEAQAFFEAAGGPESDPHRLDGSDGDGLACESLP